VKDARSVAGAVTILAVFVFMAYADFGLSRKIMGSALNSELRSGVRVIDMVPD